MSYLAEHLMKDEELIYLARPHWIIFGSAISFALLSFIILVFGSQLRIGQFSFGGGYQFQTILSGIFLIIALVQGLVSYVIYISSEYGITNKRVLMKVGLIRRNSLEIMLRKIESIHVIQSIPGRILNYGVVIICGTGGSKDLFRHIPDPLSFRKTTQEQIELQDQQSYDRKE